MTHKIHYYAGLIMAFFISLHLLNHMMIFISVETHLQFMEVARKIYRNPISETVLMIAIIVQVRSGIQLFRRKWPRERNLFDKLQLFSGLYFVYFLISHTTAIMVGRYYLDLDTNLYYGAAVVNRSPILYFFILHYGLAIFAFFAHIGSLHYIRVRAFVSEGVARKHGMIILLLGILLACLIVGKLMLVKVPDAYLYAYDVFFE